MADNRLLAVLTAMILAGGVTPGRTAADLDQLLQIEQLVLSNDCQALYRYLSGNPGVLEGSDPLTVEFRNFMGRVDGGVILCLSARESIGQPSLADRLAGQY